MHLPAPHALLSYPGRLVVNGCNFKSIFTRRIKVVARFYWIIITSEIFICCKYYFVIKCLALFPWRAASRSCSYSCLLSWLHSSQCLHYTAAQIPFDICRALLPMSWITGCIQVEHISYYIEFDGTVCP